MQSGGPPLPEFDDFGHEPIPAPERGTGDRLSFELPIEFQGLSLERLAIGNRLALL